MPNVITWNCFFECEVFDEDDDDDSSNHGSDDDDDDEISIVASFSSFDKETYETDLV